MGVGEVSIMLIGERDMTEDIRAGDVQQWIELLHSRVPTERLTGATELASLAVRTWTRGGIRTRGTISQAAPSRLPEGVSLSAAVEAFHDQHVEVRRAVAFALGEWADETAVHVLRQSAAADAESAVRGEAIDALGKIGGQQAVAVLKRAARYDRSVDVRIRAVRALADLANAERSASQGVVEALEHVKQEDPAAPVKRQADAALARLGRT